MAIKKSKKAFREYLNKEFSMAKGFKWKHNQFHQRTREYGDYLYNQDRVMFNVNYEEWLKDEKQKNQPPKV